MTPSHRARPALLLAASLVLLAAGAAAYDAAPVEGGGRIAGRVTVTSRPAERPPAGVDPDCPGAGADPTLAAGADGGLANAAVMLVDIARGAPVDATRRGRLSVGKCGIEPRVQALSIGQVLEVRNDAPVACGIRSYRNGEDVAFDLDMPMQGQVVLQRLKKPGIHHLVTRDERDWMRAYLVVAEHPYVAVTGPDGRFSLANVPPGRYRIRVWHERLGDTTRAVEVTAGGESRADVALDAR